MACLGVTVRFGGLVAVNDVSLSVPAGGIVGLVGPNGAGKSTLFGVLSGLLAPTRGRVILHGEDITAFSPQRRARLGLARTFQHPELFAGLTVRDHLVLAHRVRHAKARVWRDLLDAGSLHRPPASETDSVDSLVDLLGLASVASRPGVGLPLGVARLVELGRALASEPSVLLLDEPSSGLDSAESEQFETTLLRLAAERRISVLLVEHDVEMVMRMCATINVVEFGSSIACGTPAQIRTDPAVRAAYLGETLEEAAATDAGPAIRTAPMPPVTSASPPAAAPAISVSDLSVRYGDALALAGVSFDLAPGRALAVLGPNGAGKSSLARAVSGLVPPASGSIHLAGRDVTGWAAHRVRRAGLVHLPEGRGVFRELSVLDNVRMAARSVPGRAGRRQALDAAFDAFPVLAQRRRQQAGSLSGGEQQMLSLARALATSPTVIVADEMSLGLAPLMVDLVFASLERARREGVTVVMIEQYVHRALAFADDCIVLSRGRPAWSGPAADAGREVLGRYLGAGATP